MSESAFKTPCGLSSICPLTASGSLSLAPATVTKDAVFQQRPRLGAFAHAARRARRFLPGLGSPSRPRNLLRAWLSATSPRVSERFIQNRHSPPPPTHTRAHAHIVTHTHTHVHSHSLVTHTQSHSYMHIHTDTHTHMYILTHAHRHTCITHTLSHTHTHTQADVLVSRGQALLCLLFPAAFPNLGTGLVTFWILTTRVLHK